MLAVHVEAHVMHGCLCLIDEDEFCRLELGHLPCHLRTDGACSTRDEDALPLQHFPDGFHIHLYLLAGQQILNLHFMQRLVRELTLAVPLLSLRHHHDLDAGLDELVDELLLLAELIGLQRGHYEHLGSGISHLMNQITILRVHLHVHQIFGTQVIVRRNKPLQQVRTRHLVLHAFGQCHAALLHTIDEGSL